jgi:hypothetical protein
VDELRKFLTRYGLERFADQVEQRFDDGWTVEDVLAELREQADVLGSFLVVDADEFLRRHQGQTPP